MGAHAWPAGARRGYPHPERVRADRHPRPRPLAARTRWRRRWREDRFEPRPPSSAAADAAIAALEDRGSPSHDGLAARLAGYERATARLELELQPMRWSLRLVRDDARGSLSVLCVVRDADGRWLAGRRAAWVATWAGRWALGAGGAVEVGEDPVQTLARELEEEWSVAPERLAVEALVSLPNRLAMLDRPGLAARRRRGHARRRARRARLVARRPGRLARGGRPGAAADGRPPGVTRVLRPAQVPLLHPLGDLPDAADRLARPRAGRAELVLGWAHGIGWIVMSLLCIDAVRRRVIPLWLAVMVAVVGGVGPFAGTIGFIVEETPTGSAGLTR